jgi:histidinol-phosphate aminotransferase
MPVYTSLVESLPATVPFVGPEAQERQLGRPFRARLGANESVFGPSPKTIEAMQRAAGEIWKYADPENIELRQALARFHGVKPSNIVVGEGIDGLLGLLVRLLVAEGTPVVTSNGAYPTFNYHVAGFGGQLRKVPYRQDREDPEALLMRAKAMNAALIYLANPDNPMGTWHGAETIASMIANLPEQCVLCLDEAYSEFAPAGSVPPIDVNDPRVIRMRTFSKAHGMAGVRIGYAIAHEDLIGAFNKVRNHFGVNRIAQEGALAALQDQDWLFEVVGNVVAARTRLNSIAEGHGLRVVPSATNFVAIDCGRDGAFAKSVLDGLIQRGIFVRMPFVAPQDRCIRVSAGTEAHLDLFEEAFADVLKDVA